MCLFCLVSKETKCHSQTKIYRNTRQPIAMGAGVTRSETKVVISDWNGLIDFLLYELCIYVHMYVCICGPGSIVGTATGYGLEGPGIECGPGSSVGIATGYGLNGLGIACRWG